MISNNTICILSNDYPSEGRPVYVFVEQLVNALIDKGIKVDVVAPQSLTRCLIRRTPILPKEKVYITPTGGKYRVYRPYSLSLGKANNTSYYLVKRFNQRTLYGSLNRIQPNVLYGHFWRNAYLLKDYAIKKKIPLFVACGEGDDAMEILVKSLSLQEKKELVKAVRGVISVSTENRRKCIDYGLAKEENVIVLPNAVDARLFYPREKDMALRRQLKVNDDDFLILFVGSFIPRKGCGVLAKAIDRIGDSHVKVIFVGAVIPGDADEPECNGIIYKGQMLHGQLPAYYASADVFVLPTLKEGCSNAILEALAMGLPVISSTGAFNDDILNDDNSIRINPADVDELAAAITSLRDDDAYRKRLSAGALESTRSLTIDQRAVSIIKFIKRQMEVCRNNACLQSEP